MPLFGCMKKYGSTGQCRGVVETCGPCFIPFQLKFTYIENLHILHRHRTLQLLPFVLGRSYIKFI